MAGGAPALQRWKSALGEIEPAESFHASVRAAVQVAIERDSLVTFGIQPGGPETGYGYIEQGEGNRVASFKEKPDLAVARDYLAKGNYFWNSFSL